MSALPLTPQATRPIDIALVMAGHSYNEEDFAPLAAEAGVRLRVVRFTTDLGTPDCIMLPGTPDAAADFDIMEAEGMTDALQAHAARGGWIAGICGGMHMMSKRLYDPQHVKYSFDEKPMLGLLDLDTVYSPEPAVFRRLHRVTAPGGCLLRGFETHRGQCRGNEPVLFRREDGSAIGYGHQRLWGTYLHRCFDSAPFRHHLLTAIRCGMASLSQHPTDGVSADELRPSDEVR